jgi:hypothetical protein
VMVVLLLRLVRLVRFKPQRWERASFDALPHRQS